MNPNPIASEVERAAQDLWRVARDLREGRCSALEAMSRITRATIEAQSAVVEAAEKAHESSKRCSNGAACPVGQSRAGLVSLRLVAQAG